MTAAERRGYLFWGPTVVLILIVEALGALSTRFEDWIPWPTISETVGRLEKLWAGTAVVVVGLLSVVIFHALASDVRKRPEGRTVREGAPAPARASWYSPWLVLSLTVLAFVLARVAGATRMGTGYAIYATLALFGIVSPSVLAFGFNRLAGFPTLFFTVDQLRGRIQAVALILVSGLAILTVHLAFYPWPDITHQSASFAGLTADRAKQRAERELRKIRQGLPRLVYSTQARGVTDGHDTWFVYFQPNCVVQVTKAVTTPSPECAT